MINAMLHPRVLFIRLLLLAIHSEVITGPQLMFLVETFAAFFSIQGAPQGFHSIIEVYRACLGAEDCHSRQRGYLPEQLNEVYLAPTPAQDRAPKSLAVWQNHPFQHSLKTRVPASLEHLRALARFADQTMPPVLLHGHKLLVQSFQDTTFHLQNLADFLNLLPPPTARQTFPSFDRPAPGTPPLDSFTGWAASTFISEMWWQFIWDVSFGDWDWHLVTVQFERLHLENRFAIWATSTWHRIVLPHVEKERTWAGHLQSFEFAHVVLIFCDVISRVLCLVCVHVIFPLLVLAWRIHDISPCYGGLHLGWFTLKGLVCPKNAFFCQCLMTICLVGN